MASWQSFGSLWSVPCMLSREHSCIPVLMPHVQPGLGLPAASRSVRQGMALGRGSEPQPRCEFYEASLRSRLKTFPRALWSLRAKPFQSLLAKPTQAALGTCRRIVVFHARPHEMRAVPCKIYMLLFACESKGPSTRFV